MKQETEGEGGSVLRSLPKPSFDEQEDARDER